MASCLARVLSNQLLICHPRMLQTPVMHYALRASSYSVCAFCKNITLCLTSTMRHIYHNRWAASIQHIARCFVCDSHFSLNAFMIGWVPCAINNALTLRAVILLGVKHTTTWISCVFVVTWLRWQTADFLICSNKPPGFICTQYLHTIPIGCTVCWKRISEKLRNCCAKNLTEWRKSLCIVWTI